MLMKTVKNVKRAGLDAIHYKIKENGRFISKAVYTILGLNIDGKKELLGLYLSESEGAHHWLSVLTDLHNRGVQDILIACVDGLKGFPEAIVLSDNYGGRSSGNYLGRLI